MSAHAQCPSWEQLKANCMILMRGTECVCGGHKWPFSALCKHCYFALPEELHAKLFPVMAIGLLVRGDKWGDQRVSTEFWDKYPHLFADCIRWLKENTNRIGS